MQKLTRGVDDSDPHVDTAFNDFNSPRRDCHSLFDARRRGTADLAVTNTMMTSPHSDNGACINMHVLIPPKEGDLIHWSSQIGYG